MILLFSVNLPTPVWVLLGLVPLLLVIIGWTLKLKFRKPETVAFGCNGSQWAKWLFLLWILMIIINEWVAPAVNNFPNQYIPHVGRTDGLNFVIHGFTFYCFICYFFVSFRELNEEQAANAKSAKGLVFSLAKSAGAAAVTAGQASVGVLGMIWSFIMAAAYPIISVTSTTITYVSASAGMFFASIAMMIPVVVIVAVIGAFAIMALFFLTCLVMYVLAILKFLQNMYITFAGPSSVAYKVDNDELD